MVVGVLWLFSGYQVGCYLRCGVMAQLVVLVMWFAVAAGVVCLFVEV